MYQVDSPNKRWMLVAEEKSGEKAVREINELFSRGDYNGAYPQLCEAADSDYKNAHLNVVAGLVAFSIGKSFEASRYFERALLSDPNDADALHNNAVLRLSTGDIESAQKCFERLAEVRPTDASVYNELAVIWMNKGDVEKVRQYLTMAIELNPNYNLARKNGMEFALSNNMIDWGLELLDLNNRQPGLTANSVKDIHLWIKTIIHQQHQSEWVTVSTPNAPSSLQISKDTQCIANKKIAMFASYSKSVKEIIEKLKKDNNQVREFKSGSSESMLELMDWADLAWFDWCDNLLVEATKHPKKCPIICRIVSSESFLDMSALVDWTKIDRLIFINHAVEELVRPAIKWTVPWSIIQDGVNCDKYQIPKDKHYGKKIASVGHINYKKNPTLMLYCFKKIHQYDREYTFHIAGAHQDARIKLYFDNFLKENPLPITFYGWVDDVATWYQDKDFKISTSLFESFHHSLAEGMASGLMPLIHNWYGAKYIYPNEYLFDDPDTCLDILKKYEQCNKEEEAEKNRRYIAGRYNANDKFNQMSRLLNKEVSHEVTYNS